MRKFILFSLSGVLLLLLGCSSDTSSLVICGSEINKNLEINIKWFDSTTNYYEEKLILKINENETKKIGEEIYRICYRRIAQENNKLFFVGSSDGSGFVDYEKIVDCKNNRHINLASFAYDSENRLLSKTVWRYYDRVEDIPQESKVGLDLEPIFNYFCKESK